ncbi:hypothetical protein AURANDRAFT_67486 [Aureococcus anophagefferens]|uniref:Uncharacterized protein n=1 Tax=Aureococcus anophagefferens TaxID=44056 RepID=F0YLB5_AURAN|nr:hypothetical protein AURANDRAFT_67486 [Aureococcus anophagefferens]EGB04106.1 hypothetical protein AURANDRAFT_67486 [Aureococcus anophagefferens]|eukprot:XP_009041231.1 hypothetical protein AURANDRAFT_67486 [Aureococcus anophagefferens]
MRHRQAVHGQRRAGLPDEQRARHGRAGGQRRRRELRHGLALGLLLMRSRLGLWICSARQHDYNHNSHCRALLMCFVAVDAALFMDIGRSLCVVNSSVACWIVVDWRHSNGLALFKDAINVLVGVGDQGAGLSGLLLARRTVCDGHPVTVLEKGKAVGGVWHLQANAQSKVNTTEAAYRVAERGVVINFDHPLTFQIMNDLQFISTIYLTQ